MIKNFFNNTLLVLSLTLTTQIVHADNTMTCPSVETLKQTYAFGMALPYEYNKASKSVNFASVAIPMTSDGYAAHLGLVIYPVPVGFSEDPGTNTLAMINQLVQETPITIHYSIDNDAEVAMCIYSLPGQDNVTAFLIDIDGDIDGDQSLHATKNKMSRREQAMQFLKFVNVNNKAR